MGETYLRTGGRPVGSFKNCRTDWNCQNLQFNERLFAAVSVAREVLEFGRRVAYSPTITLSGCCIGPLPPIFMTAR